MSKLKPLLQTVPIHFLERGGYQPRLQFDSTALQELAQSIKTTGLLQPIVVRPSTKSPNKFEIIAGERRWRAAQIAGLETVDCLVKNFSNEQAAQAALIENIIRINLNPIEEAKAYQRLSEDFDYTHEEIAASVGKSRTQISHALRLLTLTLAIQKLVSCGDLSEGHGKMLCGLPIVLQESLAQQCLTQGWSVRQLEQAVKKAHVADTKKKLPINKPDANLAQLEQQLSDYLGCQVTIRYQDGAGQVSIQFQNLDILDGVLAKIGFKTEF